MVRKIHEPENPGPDPARPARIDAAFDQRGDGERKGHREADIADIEQRRMEGEAGILQHRIESVALGRRGREADEGVGRGDDEYHKGGGDCALHGEDGARKSSGRFDPNSHTAAPNSDRISTHRSIEPSWFPQTPAIL